MARVTPKHVAAIYIYNIYYLRLGRHPVAGSFLCYIIYARTMKID